MFIGNSKVELTQTNSKMCHGAITIGKLIHTASHAQQLMQCIHQL